MGPLGETLVAWALLPALVYATALGLGLLVTRLARLDVPNALIVPLGLSVAIVLAAPAFRLDAGAWPSAVIVFAGAAAGLALCRRELSRRVNPGPAGLGALAVYVLFLGPVLLSGGWTWTGYNFVNDTALQLQLTDHLAADGLAAPIEENQLESASSSDAAVFFYLRAFYPLGSHGLLAVLGAALPAPTAALYQPFLAALVAIAGMALAVLATRVTGRAVIGAVAGALAVASNLLYVYALQGNVKEVAAFATFAIAAAMGRELLDDVRIGTAACFGACLAAVLVVFSSAAAPMVLGLGVLVLGVALARAGPRPARRLARPIAAALAVLALATVVGTELMQSYKVLSNTFSTAAADDPTEFESAGGAPSELGHLLRPLPLVQAAGIWLAEDYRAPVPGRREAVTAVGIVLVIVLAGAGLLVMRRRREWGPLLLVAPTLAAVAVAGPRVSPYAAAKLLAIASPGVVLLAVLGAFALLALSRIAGLAAGALLALGVLGSDAIAYHAVRLAPTDRMLAMEDVARRYPDRGDLLVSEPDEYVKYFMRGAPNVSVFDPVSPRQVGLRQPQFYVGRPFDLDEQRLDFIQSYPLLVQRRAPNASRPPANFELDYANRFYLVWRRTAGPRVLEHLPLQAAHQYALRPSCSEVRRLAARAGGRRRLIAAEGERLVLLDPSRAPHPPGWPKHPVLEGTVTPVTPGRSYRRAAVRDGRYAVWIQGSFGRPVAAIVGGREVGRANGVNTPGGWHRVGTLDLRDGHERLELHRGGGGLAPGDGYGGDLGPLALAPARPGRLVTVSPDRATSLCGRTWDWIEVVGRG